MPQKAKEEEGREGSGWTRRRSLPLLSFFEFEPSSPTALANQPSPPTQESHPSLLKFSDMSAIVYSLWVINKAGGLVFDKQLNRELVLPSFLRSLPSLSSPFLPLPRFLRISSSTLSRTAGLPPISQNDALILAGTLHGIHAITGKLSPVDGAQEGVETIEGDGVKMIILLTATGEWIRRSFSFLYFEGGCGEEKGGREGREERGRRGRSSTISFPSLPCSFERAGCSLCRPNA